MLGVITKSVTKTRYAQLKSKMLKGSKNARHPRTAIKRIGVLNVGLKNMFPSPVNVDYAHPAGQKQQTNGQIEFIIFVLKSLTGMWFLPFQIR